MRFTCEGKEYEVEAAEEEGCLCVRFGDSWYRDADEFFAKATIDGERIPTLYRKLCAFKVV